MKNVSLKTFGKNFEGYIRHEYPKDGIFHPFDITCNLQHFLFAGGFTYLMSIDKTKNIEDIKKIIPKSYMPFDICERWFIVYNGEIMWKNNDVNKNEEFYKVLSFNKEEIEPNNFTNEIPITKDFDTDLKVIIEKSQKRHQKNIYMFVKVI